MGRTRNYQCWGTATGEIKRCISNRVEGSSVVFVSKVYDKKNRPLGCLGEDCCVIPIGEPFFALLFEAGSVIECFPKETPVPLRRSDIKCL